MPQAAQEELRRFGAGDDDESMGSRRKCRSHKKIFVSKSSVIGAVPLCPCEINGFPE